MSYFVCLSSGEPLQFLPGPDFKVSERRTATVFRSREAALGSAYMRGLNSGQFRVEEVASNRDDPTGRWEK